MKCASWSSAAAGLLPCLVFLSLSPSAPAGDWPTWGRDASRNMVSPEKNLATAADVGKEDGDKKPETKNVKWAAKLGSHAYGNPVVAGGRVFVGTNNENPRDPKYVGDRGVLLCLDAETAALRWLLAVPKLPAGRNLDSPDMGICSSPTVDGDRVYVLTNRCEVLCLDVNGLANGNDGPFKDEAQYVSVPENPPIELGPTDADIVWRLDLSHELGVLPHLMTSSAALVVGDRLYVTTCNGTDWTEKHVPSPWAPALVCLDKKTGKVLGQEKSGAGARPFFGSWSSPAYGVVGGKPTVVFGGGDGVCYGFDPEPATGPDGTGVLKELWRIDGNPPGAREKNGKPLTARTPDGPSEIIATPVVAGDRAYVAVGQITEAGLGKGAGCLTCIGPGPDGKIAPLWRYTKAAQSMSTVSVEGGLLFLPDANGFLHCLDSLTGTPYWTHDLEAEVWGAALVADGKVYVGVESGEMNLFAAAKEKKLLGKIDFRNTIYSSPLAANGVLYVATEQTLYAIK